MENSFRYFENHSCRYYPCHNIEHINCLFCYCPLYFLDDCPGKYTIKEKDGRKLKVCTDCNYPHEYDNYPEIMKRLKAAVWQEKK